MLKRYSRVFDLGHIVISIIFVFSAFALIVLAVIELWAAVDPFLEKEVSERFNEVLDTVSLLVIAAATLALG